VSQQARPRPAGSGAMRTRAAKPQADVMFRRRSDGGNSPYQLLPDLSAAEYEALKADVAARGVLVPIERDEEGRTLDGHHRERICGELGITDYPVIVRTGLSEQAKVEHLLKVNLLRRHLGQVAWAQAFRRLAESRGATLGSRGGPAGNRRTVEQLAAELGVDRSTAFRRLGLADKLAPHADLAAKVDAGEMEPKRALEVVRTRDAEARPEPPASAIPATADCRLGDFREVLADVENGSVDLIYTDPPYLGSTMAIYEDLGSFAARVLKPDGLLLCEVGTMFLPEAIRLLEQHLRYHWCIGLVLPGKRARVHARHVVNGWRPVLAFARTDGEPRRWLYDLFTVPDPPTKAWHPWEKAVAPARYYIDKLTDPGDLVVDPFLGSGTNAIAAVSLGRRFVGCDIDPKAMHATRVRLAEGVES